MANMTGGHLKTLHPRKLYQNHQVERGFWQWVLWHRGRQILVAENMIIKRAMEVSATIRRITPPQLEQW